MLINQQQSDPSPTWVSISRATAWAKKGKNKNQDLSQSLRIRTSLGGWENQGEQIYMHVPATISLASSSAASGAGHCWREGEGASWTTAWHSLRPYILDKNQPQSHAYS